MRIETLDVRSIFDHALDIASEAERTAYLDEACAAAPEIRHKVDALLNAYANAGSFLEEPAIDRDQTGVFCPVTESAGSQIGPYKLLEQIGEGGMGVVFMAEQTRPVQRRVALKIIKAGMDTRQVVARFEAERQALAMMDHPNIARVLDAGATGGEPGCVSAGRPYFVMELVRGVPMTEFCNQKNLSIRERLELFVTVCQAVQHAHQKGIIHRDIKPTNVLVTLHDGRPMIKVIDFGVAKATGQKLTDKTLFTGFTQMIGTPLYMSPEQAEMTSQDIDTRSDIFSAGVLLYELLTGTTPFDSQRLKSASFDELRRIIREEEPPRPSTRLTTLALEAASTVGTHRRSDPRQLSRLFRGELDWIVMKCLEKDRTRRYETASALAGDVERYLHDEPVQACPPSARYRFGKFARRNKSALLTVAVVALALVGGIMGTTWEILRASDALNGETTERRRANQQTELALETLKLVVDDVQTKLALVPGADNVRKGVLKTVTDGLKKVSRNMNGASHPDLASMRSHIELGEIIFNAERFQPSLAAGRETFTLSATGSQTKTGPDQPNWLRPAADDDPLDTYIASARRTAKRGSNADAALEQFQIACGMANQLVRDNPRDVEAEHELLRLYDVVGQQMGDSVNPGAIFNRGVEISERLLRDNPRDYLAKNWLASMNLNSGRCVWGRSIEEIFSYNCPKLQKALETYQTLIGEDPKNADLYRFGVSNAQSFLGYFNLKAGNAVAARDQLHRSFEYDLEQCKIDPRNAGNAFNIVLCNGRLTEAYFKSGDFTSARATTEKALECSQKAATNDPNNHWLLVSQILVHGAFSAIYKESRDVSAARNAARMSLESYQRHAAAYPGTILDDEIGPARSLELLEWVVDQALSQGDVSAARDDSQKCVAVYESLYRIDGSEWKNEQLRPMALAYEQLADAELRLGKLSPARDAMRRALKLAGGDVRFEPLVLEHSNEYEELGDICMETGAVKVASDAYQMGRESARKQAEHDPQNAAAQRALAIVYEKLGDAKRRLNRPDTEAHGDYQQAEEIATKLTQNDPGNRQTLRDVAVARLRMGDLNQESGSAAAARHEYRQALKGFLALAKDQPKNPAAQAELAYCFGECAYLQQAAEEFPSAIRNFEEGIAILEKMRDDETFFAHDKYPIWLESQQSNLEVCKQSQLAIDNLESALQRWPENAPEYLALRGRVFARHGRASDATAAAEQLAALKPRTAENLFHAGEAYALCFIATDVTNSAAPSTEDVTVKRRYRDRAIELLKQAFERWTTPKPPTNPRG